MTIESEHNLPGFGRRRFVVGAAVAGTALAALQAHKAHAAPDAPAAGKLTYKAAPAKQAAVQGNTVAAFPGCEGAGKFTTGGRGGKIYEVTTLEESGKGSLRDAVSEGDRIVVFRVGGTIELSEGIKILGNNITIAGQTAPGDGILIKGNEFKVQADNVIIRYLRVRAGDELGLGIDTMNGRGHRNIVVDHCSVGWGVDECFSLYGNYDVTVSNCIIHEGLSMSRHDKGLHGYGGLWGGQNISYYNNLLIHQGGRNPRFSFTEDMKMLVDHRNNVIYDYGYTSCYGAEWCEGINMIGNYYKPGPATLDSVAPHVVEPYRGGNWYISGNKIEGHDDITKDNTKGIVLAVGGITLLDEPAAIPNPRTSTSADDAYQAVLDGVGASIPHYDSVDARLLNELRTGTGRLINSQIEVGGFPLLENGDAPKDSDGDGIPDDWESEHGLDPQDPADATAIGTGGYANVELYVNSIEPDITSYPQVSITAPAAGQVISNGKATKSVTVSADATAVDGSKITKVEFYANDQLIGTSTAAPYRVTWSKAPLGTFYLTARVYDDRGVKVQSSGSAVHLAQKTAVKPWVSKDIGDVPRPGSDYIDATTGDITIWGAGKIRSDGSTSSDTTTGGGVGPGTDAFHFLYQPITAGPNDVVEIIARIDDLSREWDRVYAGLMFRESLEPDAPFFTGGVMVARDGLKDHVSRIRSFATEASVSDYPYEEDEVNSISPRWVRLIKRGPEFEAHFGNDSLQWTRVGYERIVMPKKLYVGLVVDSARQDNKIINYSTARFHNVKING
ncbi:MAG TPA: Ig-like domain-containing protein [Microlunatus sp.]